MATNPKQKGDKNSYSGYFQIVAWILSLGIVLLISKTKIGYTLLFFFVIASIIIVLAIGSPTIVNIFGSAQK